MNVDQVSQADVAPSAPGTATVEVHDDVLGTADVEIVADAAPEPHPAVHGRRHQYRGTWPTGGVERLVQAIIARRCDDSPQTPLNNNNNTNNTTILTSFSNFTTSYKLSLP